MPASHHIASKLSRTLVELLSLHTGRLISCQRYRTPLNRMQWVDFGWNNVWPQLQQRKRTFQEKASSGKRTRVIVNAVPIAQIYSVNTTLNWTTAYLWFIALDSVALVNYHSPHRLKWRRAFCASRTHIQATHMFANGMDWPFSCTEPTTRWWRHINRITTMCRHRKAMYNQIKYI